MATLVHIRPIVPITFTSDSNRRNMTSVNPVGIEMTKGEIHPDISPSNGQDVSTVMFSSRMSIQTEECAEASQSRVVNTPRTSALSLLTDASCAQSCVRSRSISPMGRPSEGSRSGERVRIKEEEDMDSNIDWDGDEEEEEEVEHEVADEVVDEVVDGKIDGDSVEVPGDLERGSEWKYEKFGRDEMEFDTEMRTESDMGSSSTATANHSPPPSRGEVVPSVPRTETARHTTTVAATRGTRLRVLLLGVMCDLLPAAVTGRAGGLGGVAAAVAMALAMMIAAALMPEGR